MSAITIQLPTLHSGQRAIFDDRHRFKAVSAGRRFGKTKLGALICFAIAAQNGRAWWVAPSYGIALIGWRMMRQLAAQVPGVTIRESERMITLPTGGTVQIKSADNPDSLRGEGLDFVVLDECAFLKEEAWTEVLRPALADRQGGALFISTPKGRNWFWHIWQRANYDAAWKSFHFTSYDNPFVAATELDSTRDQLPERVYRQEILAEFLEDGGGVFRGVRRAATAEPQQNNHIGHTYVIGADWARDGDFSCFIVLDVTTSQVVAMDRFNHIDYHIQVGRLCALADRFKPAAIIAEANSIGAPVIEQLRRQSFVGPNGRKQDYPVIPFQTTNATKQVAVDALALAFEREQIRILPDEILIGELEAFTMERLPSGMIRYSAPDAGHDDTVVALMLAWQGVNKTGRRARVGEY
jgi:hypothetical protein